MKMESWDIKTENAWGCTIMKAERGIYSAMGASNIDFQAVKNKYIGTWEFLFFTVTPDALASSGSLLDTDKDFKQVDFTQRNCLPLLLIFS